MSQIEVGILGATGAVGQQFVALLANHPWFKVKWLGASQRSEGKAYQDAAAWRLPAALPDDVARLGVDAATPGRAPKLVFSGWGVTRALGNVTSPLPSAAATNW